MRKDELNRADAYQMYLAGLINENAYLSEVVVDDKSLEDLIREYHRLSEELSLIKKELEQRETRSKEISRQLAPILEAMEDTEDRMLQVDDIVVTIKKTGSTYQRPHYEKIYTELLTRVDDELRALMEELKATLFSQVNVSTTLGVRKLEHGIVSRLGDMVSGAWRRILSLIGIVNHRIDMALAEFRRATAS